MRGQRRSRLGKTSSILRLQQTELGFWRLFPLRIHYLRSFSLMTSQSHQYTSTRFLVLLDHYSRVTTTTVVTSYVTPTLAIIHDPASSSKDKSCKRTTTSPFSILPPACLYRTTLSLSTVVAIAEQCVTKLMSLSFPLGHCTRFLLPIVKFAFPW